MPRLRFDKVTVPLRSPSTVNAASGRGGGPGDHAAVDGELAVVAGAPDDPVGGHELDRAALVRALGRHRAELLVLVLQEEDAVAPEPRDQESVRRELLLLGVRERDVVRTPAVLGGVRYRRTG